ncbi:MAG TPA: GGDEF domain-containing protein, partial [Spirochaetota bacterium]|nr:GGDEF domain-containing protein [Spirochaetota bacterium]
MKNEEKQELVKEIVDLIDSENSKDKSNHKDIIEYFFNKRSKKTVDYIKKVEKYIKEEAFFENLTESLQNMIDEIKFLRHRLIDDLNNILSNHGDMSITQFEIDKERRDLSHKVVYDALTSVNTRDFTLQNLRKSIMLFSRNKDRIFTLLMLDIDHFKTINDTYGHVIGDEILKLVGQILNISIRESDVAGRFGGEEFMIILTDTEIKSSLMV